MTELKSILKHTIGDNATEAVEGFAKSFAYNLAQKPVTAIVQEVNKVAGSALLPKLEFISPPPAAAEGTSAWKGEKAGEVCAVVPWLMLGSKALRKVEVLADTGLVMSTARAGIAGDVYGTLLQPVQNEHENFYAQKLENGAAVAAGAATFTALQKGVGGESSLSRTRQILAGETAALGAGLVTENARSVIENKSLLSVSQDSSYLEPYAVLGTAAALKNLSIVRNAHSDLSFMKRDDLVWDLPHGGQAARELNAARRAEDLASGTIPVVENSKIFDEFAGKGAWQVFKNRNDKELLIDKTKSTVAKIFNADDLADQAAALKKIEGEFGVTVPQNLVLHTNGEQAALTMDYVEHKTGQDVYILANTKPMFGFQNRQADYLDLYQQGESLASRIHRSLDDKLFFADMHDENWGFRPETIRNWRAGKTLNPHDMIVTDPVTGWTETQSRHAVTFK